MYGKQKKDVFCQSRHANGAVAKEYALVDGRVVGTMREWHDNGILAKETPFVEGRVHGTVRQWNRDGKLLGEYSMREGRGIELVWNEDGSPQTEFEQIAENAAWSKVWDDLGKAREMFLWNGKPISKARWLKKVEEAGIPGAELEQRFGTARISEAN